MKLYPYEKGGGRSFSHAEGELKSFGVVFTVAFYGSHRPSEGGGGAKRFYPVLRQGGGGAQNVPEPRFVIIL